VPLSEGLLNFRLAFHMLLKKKWPQRGYDRYTLPINIVRIVKCMASYKKKKTWKMFLSARPAYLWNKMIRKIRHKTTDFIVDNNKNSPPVKGKT
jgi:hypothetical protein